VVVLVVMLMLIVGRRYDGVPGRYVDIVGAINAVFVKWAAEHLVRRVSGGCVGR
jgi:hypothetical protein